MSGILSIAVLAAAGVMLVVQNLLMVRITTSVSTVLITLVLNSSVGLVLLLSGLVVRNGLAGLTELTDAFKPWHLLPGILGSFFVFASIFGYQRMGASATISTLVASQMLAGLIADRLKSGSFIASAEPLLMVGAVLLILGVMLIVQRKG